MSRENLYTAIYLNFLRAPLAYIACLQMYDVRAIANWFLDRAERADKSLTAMKLQKLIYVAHGWSLAFGKPLVHEAVEAWKWGPVFRSVYREFRDFGSETIEIRATAFDGSTLEEKIITINDYDDSDETEAFLESVWQSYGDYTAGQLMNITHRDGTPWHKMFEKMGRHIKPFTVIPNELIQEHYEKLLNERATPQGAGS